jgi:uncharacterized protein YegP (UPF0339 family)
MKKSVRNSCVLLALVALIALAGAHFALRAENARLEAAAAAAQAKKDKDKDGKAGAVFELYKDNGGKFRFRLKHDGEIVAIAGKGYATKADCQKVIEAIRRDAAKARLDDQAK